MRILIVSQYFWPEGFRINDIVKSLVEKGIEVDVLTGKPNYPEGSIYTGYTAFGCQYEQWHGAAVYRVPLVARGVQSALRLVLNYCSFVLSGLVCGPWLLRRRHYDAIFVYAPSPILQAIPAIFLGWLKRSPVVIWVQDLWPESLSATGHVRNQTVLNVVERVVRFIYRHTDLLLVQSKAFEQPVRKLASNTPIIYYPNSVDEAFCVPSTVAVPDIQGMNDGFTVMFAGNIGVAQAVEVIVEAATLLKDYSDIHFVVLGQGSRWEWMRQEVETRGLANLYLPGRFPVETMPGLMQKASALLVTLTDQPIFAVTVPNKVQAYMASGKPILACLNGEGARVVIEAKAGLAVPAEDAQGLAAAILRLYEMTPGERDKLGSNGRHFYKAHFNHAKLVNELIGYFETVSQTT